MAWIDGLARATNEFLPGYRQRTDEKQKRVVADEEREANRRIGRMLAEAAVSSDPMAAYTDVLGKMKSDPVLAKVSPEVAAKIPEMIEFYKEQAYKKKRDTQTDLDKVTTDRNAAGLAATQNNLTITETPPAEGGLLPGRTYGKSLIGSENDAYNKEKREIELTSAKNANALGGVNLDIAKKRLERDDEIDTDAFTSLYAKRESAYVKMYGKTDRDGNWDGSWKSNAPHVKKGTEPEDEIIKNTKRLMKDLHGQTLGTLTEEVPPPVPKPPPPAPPIGPAPGTGQMLTPGAFPQVQTRPSLQPTAQPPPAPKQAAQLIGSPPPPANTNQDWADAKKASDYIRAVVERDPKKTKKAVFDAWKAQFGPSDTVVGLVDRMLLDIGK